MSIKDIKLSEIPEEVTEDGLKVYGPASYETQVAILSHYLHTLDGKHDIASGEKRYEILGAIRDFIEYKHQQDKKNPLWKDVNDEVVTMAAESPLECDLFSDFFNVPFPAPEPPKFTFIDLFAGIGGFRIAMQELGGKCVYSSEFDAQAQRTYFANYGEMPFGDITKEVTKQYIPKKFDVLCGGFPCQAFSLAGRRLGFKDETRGTLFFEIEEILRRHQPKAFFLENVKGLMIHDKGRTFNRIFTELAKRGYYIRYLVADACDYGIPQHRTRTYIVAFSDERQCSAFEFPEKRELTVSIFNIIDRTQQVEDRYYLDSSSVNFRRMSAFIKDTNQIYRFSDYGIQSSRDGISFTLKENMGTWHNRVPIIKDKFGIRTITPYECLALQGYPKDFVFPDIPEKSQYKQCGNTVVVPLVHTIAKKIIFIS